MPLLSDPSALVPAVAAGDRRALARLITLVEEGGGGSAGALADAYAAAVPAHRIGITGAPGSGKSTLTDRLIACARADGESIGVLAVDPTSPFSGGAVLGDRVRMQDHILDERVYVRSMASRGHLGGLSAAAPKALVVMETAGFDRILIETVGVGQDEVEVMSAADTVLVVVTAGWGDGVQAAKAGILEIGDLFVVNKADRPGVSDTSADLRAMLALGGELDWGLISEALAWRRLAGLGGALSWRRPSPLVSGTAQSRRSTQGSVQIWPRQSKAATLTHGRRQTNFPTSDLFSATKMVPSRRQENS